MAEILIPFGTLRAHTSTVTSIQIPLTDPTRIITSSRDKSVMVWSLHPDPSLLSLWPGSDYGRAQRRLTGHSHFVSDVSLSYDGQFALSASWDRDLRLWDLTTGNSTKRFVGHSNDALSVSFSPDNRQIVSGSRDKSVRIWNTLGNCKSVITDAHSDWVSVVRFSPVEPVVVSGSWDHTVRLWDVSTSQPLAVMEGHRGYVDAVAVAPDGSLCASGGREGVAILWDLGEGKRLYEMVAGSIIHALCFCPTRYWLCAATERCVVIWDLENKSVVQELFAGLHEVATPTMTMNDNHDESKKSEEQLHLQQFLPPPPPTPVKNNQRVYCTSLSWSEDGSTLFTGYTDGVVRVWSTPPRSY